VQWLWPVLIQKELNDLRDRFNNHVVRYDCNKKNPSGVAPNISIALPEEYGAVNCLQSVNVNLVHMLKEELGGEELIRFVDKAFATRAMEVFETLQTMLTMENVWLIFHTMMPLMFPAD
jgi:hypothetical protein